jgi:hypothetical protein
VEAKGVEGAKNVNNTLRLCGKDVNFNHRRAFRGATI